MDLINYGAYLTDAEKKVIETAIEHIQQAGILRKHRRGDAIGWLLYLAAKEEKMINRAIEGLNGPARGR